ncbi:MAG: ATP-binding protein [miscellaneous Crenarchaeota group-6 archaeon AD8-1]|nr:MAG: ATP-binding protein [miscellaneous Crenarchaeota group-6 archaeon AD8-1]
MIDPRSSVIHNRLKNVKRVIAVSSGKGGVGKSMIATTLALTLARRGLKIGLFDLDFTSPSTHLIMGVKNISPKEERGIIPPRINSLSYMSLFFYSGEFPIPLRGEDISNALIELLSITQWGALDMLIIDMPPGIGDAVLDIIKLVRKIEFLIVTTSSKLAFHTVKKQIQLFKELKIRVIGIIENMKISETESIKKETKKLNLNFLGEIPFDKTLEESLGDCNKLLATNFSKIVNELFQEID